MARGINKVILIGNLGADPEVRYTQGGSAVANLRMATSESWRDKQSNEMKEQTEWHRVACFGRLAEIAGEYLRKGSKVYIEGGLRTRQWERDGQTHYTTEIIARELQMLDGRAQGGGTGAPGMDDGYEPAGMGEAMGGGGGQYAQRSSGPRSGGGGAPSGGGAAAGGAAAGGAAGGGAPDRGGNRPMPRSAPAPAPAEDFDDDIPF